MGQTLNRLSARTGDGLFKKLQTDAKFVHQQGSIVSSLSCAAYPHATLGIEINAIIVYSEGNCEQVFKHLSENSLQDLQCSIDNLADKMARKNYEIAAITHFTAQTSWLHRTFEAIMIFNKL